jgi:hypothetical protein
MNDLLVTRVLVRRLASGGRVAHLVPLADLYERRFALDFALCGRRIEAAKVAPKAALPCSRCVDKRERAKAVRAKARRAS